MAKADTPTPHFLRQILDYNPDTGLLTWKPRTPDMFKCSRRSPEWACNAWNKKNAGRIASSTHSMGYVQIGINGKDFLAHRVSWAIMTGSWPSAMVDHKDLNRKNNAWGNLREATDSDNKANAKGHSDSKSGIKGVHWYKQTQKWQVQIKALGKRYHIGYFKDIEEAKNAYNDAAKKLHGEFARLN
jgi:hypothetical protein